MSCGAGVSTLHVGKDYTTFNSVQSLDESFVESHIFPETTD